MPNAAVIARRDQVQAELRDLVEQVREHQPQCNAAGCPGPVWMQIREMSRTRLLFLFGEALVKLACEKPCKTTSGAP